MRKRLPDQRLKLPGGDRFKGRRVARSLSAIR